MRQPCDFVHEGVRYRFVYWEGSARPFVLLHGFAQSARTWDDIAPCLAAQHPVYALDFVGHGESDRPTDPAAYSMNAACEVLLAFLRYVQDENAGLAPIVVGYSMGGRMALVSAVRAIATVSSGSSSAASADSDSRNASMSVVDHPPDAFDLIPKEDPSASSCSATRPTDLPFAALVLESAGLGPASSAERERVARRNEENARQLRDRGVAAFMDAWERLPLFATQRDLPQQVRAQVRDQRLSNDAEALARTFEGTGAHRMPSRSESLEALKCLRACGIPVLYLAGEYDEKYRATAEWLEAQQTANVRIVSQAGHNTHLECPESFIHILEGDFSATEKINR